MNHELLKIKHDTPTQRIVKAEMTFHNREPPS